MPFQCMCKKGFILPSLLNRQLTQSGRWVRWPAEPPFMEFHSSHKIMLRWKKTKCTKAGHVNPYKPAGGKNREQKTCGPDQAEGCDSRVFGYTM